MAKKKTDAPKRTSGALRSPPEDISAESMLAVGSAPGGLPPMPLGGLPPAPKGRLLRLREVLGLVRHEKSWLYAKMEAGLFPRGRVIGRRRFWYESEVNEALFRLLKEKDPEPIKPK